MAINHSRATPLFALKDDMSASNPDKVLSGVPFDAEFQAIIDSFTLAATDASPSFTGTASFELVQTVGDIICGGDILVSGRILEDTAVNEAFSGSYSLGQGTAALVYHTLNGATSYSSGMLNGQNVTLMVKPNGNAVTWPADIKWVGGIAPDLDQNAHNVISVWKVNNILFGSWGGSVDAS